MQVTTDRDGIVVRAFACQRIDGTLVTFRGIKDIIIDSKNHEIIMTGDMKRNWKIKSAAGVSTCDRHAIRR